MKSGDEGGSFDEEDLVSGVNRAITGRISLNDVVKHSKAQATDFGGTLTTRRLEAKPYHGPTADWTSGS